MAEEVAKMRIILSFGGGFLAVGETGALGVLGRKG